jgi:hypothetical protein
MAAATASLMTAILSSKGGRGEGVERGQDMRGPRPGQARRIDRSIDRSGRGRHRGRGPAAQTRGEMSHVGFSGVASGCEASSPVAKKHDLTGGSVARPGGHGAPAGSRRGSLDGPRRAPTKGETSHVGFSGVASGCDATSPGRETARHHRSRGHGRSSWRGATRRARPRPETKGEPSHVGFLKSRRHRRRGHGLSWPEANRSPGRFTAGLTRRSAEEPQTKGEMSHVGFSGVASGCEASSPGRENSTTSPADRSRPRMQLVAWSQTAAWAPAGSWRGSLDGPRRAPTKGEMSHVGFSGVASRCDATSPGRETARHHRRIGRAATGAARGLEPRPVHGGARSTVRRRAPNKGRNVPRGFFWSRKWL